MSTVSPMGFLVTRGRSAAASRETVTLALPVVTAPLLLLKRQ